MRHILEPAIPIRPGLNRSLPMITPPTQRRLGAARQKLPPLNHATILTSHRALTGQRLPREWWGTEPTVDDQTNQTDPAELVVHGLGQSRMRLMGENE